VALTVPVVGAMLLQSVYALVDLAFVARLGKEAVAGLSVCLQVFFVVLALGQVLAVTALAGISQAYGSGKLKEAWGLFSAFVLVSVGLGVLAAVGAFFGADTYVSWFTDDPETHRQGTIYFQINALTFFSQLLLIVIGNGFRASGDFITPVKLMVVGVLVNLVLDPLLIFGLGPFPRMEIAGAAWATVFSQCIVLVGYAVYLSRDRGERGIRLGTPAWSKSFFVHLVTRGLPAGAQFFLMSVVLGVVLVAMKPYGPLWTATAGGGFRLLQQAILPMVALGSSTAAIAGQNYGARFPGRIREVTAMARRWMLLYAVVFSVLLMWGGRIVGHLFADTPEGLDAAVLYFYWSAPQLLGFAVSFVPLFVLQALGHAVLPLVAALARMALLVILVFGIIGPRDLGPGLVFGAATVSTYLEAVLDRWLLARKLDAIEREQSGGIL
jgi:putative MATE family efflux protein